MAEDACGGTEYASLQVPQSSPHVGVSYFPPRPNSRTLRPFHSPTHISIVNDDNTITLKPMECDDRDVTWSMTAKEQGSNESFELEMKREDDNSYSDEITTNFEDPVEVAFRAANPEEARAPDGRDTNPLQLIIHAQSGSDDHMSSDSVTITQTEVATLRQEYEDVEQPNNPSNGLVEARSQDLPPNGRFIPNGYSSQRLNLTNFGASPSSHATFPDTRDGYDHYVIADEMLAELSNAADTAMAQPVNCNGQVMTFQNCVGMNQEFYFFTSHYRGPAHNKDPVDGSPISRHIQGDAMDIRGHHLDYRMLFGPNSSIQTRREALEDWLEGNVPSMNESDAGLRTYIPARGGHVHVSWPRF